MFKKKQSFLICFPLLLMGCFTAPHQNKSEYAGSNSEKTPIQRSWAELFFQLAPSSQDKVRLAIAPFNCGGRRTELGEFLREELQVEVLSDKTSRGKIELVSRSKEDLSRLLSELERQQKDLYSEEGAVKLGKLMGASHILTGKIEAMENSFRLFLTLLSVEQGRIRASCAASLAATSHYKKLFQKEVFGKTVTAEDPRIEKYRQNPWDEDSIPFCVLVYGKGVGQDQFEAYQNAMRGAKVAATSIVETKVTRDVKEIQIKDYSIRDKRAIGRNIRRSVKTIITHSSAVIKEGVPYPKSPVYRALPALRRWECHLQLKIPTIEILPGKAMDAVFRIGDKIQLIKKADQLIRAFSHRGYYGILAAFYDNLIRVFPEKSQYYYDYARLLSEQLERHSLAFKIMERGWNRAGDFSQVGGKEKFQKLLKTFEKRLYEWKYYRHQIEDVIAIYQNRDKKILKVEKIFPDRIRVKDKTRLIFPLYSSQKRYLYFLWFDGLSLGFAPQSGRTIKGSFVYSCTPGTENTQVLFTVIAGNHPWKDAPLNTIYWKSKVDRRSKGEVLKIEALLDSLARYLKENQGVTGRVEFEQIGK